MNVERNERVSRLESASVDAASQGIKALLILNGGASVALLGFIANVFSLDMDPERTRLFDAAVSSLVFFAVGAGISVVIHLVSYLANRSYVGALYQKNEDAYDSDWKRAGRWNSVAIILALISLASFGAGVYAIWLATT
ncbi:hypothetical protein WNZ14_06470 [Hoeflea sp. AS60]|uniref:hypothetical protein n=1 Tax=Hoeflea sp. AS60 TaxID=3135780 RepID=UPI00316E44D1